MTGQVGIDSQGRLWCAIGIIDQVVTFGSDRAVSSNGVWEYGNNLADTAREFAEGIVNDAKEDYNSKITSLDEKITNTNTNLQSVTDRVQTNESNIWSLKQYNTKNDSDISQIQSDITNLKDKDKSQDQIIEQTQQNIDSSISEVKQQITQNRTEIESDYNSKVQNLQTQITTNKDNINLLSTKTDKSNQDIQSNKQAIGQNKTDIQALQSRCTTIESNIQTNKTNILNLTNRVSTNESNIQTQTSRINNLSTQQTQQSSDIKSLQDQIYGRFFNTEEEILEWIKVSDNIQKLDVGAGLYLYDNNTVYYIWDGTSVLKFRHLEIPVEGYMIRNNPTGIGSISMNGCEYSTNSAVFGLDNSSNGDGSLVAGLGMQINNGYSFGVGRYNKQVSNSEIFTVGVGESNSNRKTGMRIHETGDQDLLGDIKIYNSNLGTNNRPFIAKCKSTYSFKNIPSNVRLKVDYDLFYSRISVNDNNTYYITRTYNEWFLDDSKLRSTISDLSDIGMTFVYIDGTSGTPEFEFDNKDYITVYAPPQVEVSLRNFYSEVASMNLYVDDDGDICQYESK